MMFTVHAAVGLALSALAPASTPAAFSLAFLSHCLLDALPHGDSQLEGKLSKLFIVGFIDAVIAIIIFAIFAFKFDFNIFVLTAAFIGSLTPDFLEFLHKIIAFQYRRDILLNWFHRFHGDILHCALYKKDILLKTGVFVQLIIFLIALTLSFYLW